MKELFIMFLYPQRLILSQHTRADNIMRGQVITVLLMLAIIGSWSIAYAMWSETLRVNTTVNIGSGDLDITSTKLLCKYCCPCDCHNHDHDDDDNNSHDHHGNRGHDCGCDHDCSDDCQCHDHDHDADHHGCCIDIQCGIIEVSENGERATVYVLNVKPGTEVWVGLVLSNDGDIPVKLTSIDVYDENMTRVGDVYVYGPFRAPGTSGVWGHVTTDDLPFPGNVSLPSPFCDPGLKLIAWIHMVTPDNHHDCHIDLTTQYTIIINNSISP